MKRYIVTYTRIDSKSKSQVVIEALSYSKMKQKFLDEYPYDLFVFEFATETHTFARDDK